MFLAKMSIDRPILTTMLILVLLVFGAISFVRLNLNDNPEVKVPFVTISTIYPGAGPKEIETQVTERLEDAVATVSEIKRLESYSLDGVSIVMLEFNMTKDVDVANQEVKNKVDQIVNNLPDGAQLPVVEKVDLQAFPIIDLIYSGDQSLQELYDYADNRLKDRFSQIAGVGQVGLVGGQEREIHVEFDNNAIFENMISLPQLTQILAMHNMDLPGGYFQVNSQDFTVRFEGEYTDLETIRELEIPTPFGIKKLRQIAEVKDAGEKIREKAVFYDNNIKERDDNVVRLSIIKSSEGNAVNIADEIKAMLPEIQETLPEGTSLKIVNDMSIFTKSTVDDTISNIVLGVIFTSIVLLFFLHDIRSTLIVAVSMPTSIIATFMLMEAFGMTKNTLSLMGLSVSVGVLVANSVVVLENIFRHKAMGKSKKDSAYEGTSEVTVAVLASTLTNIVVFLPLANISSIVGEFLKELALAATFATLFSLIISFTLTPMLASVILPQKQKVGPISRLIIKFEQFWEVLYGKVLKRFILRNHGIAILISFISLVLLVATMMIYAPRLGFVFMPTVDNGKIQAEIELPDGYNLEATSEVVEDIEKRLLEYDEIEYLVSNLGKKTDLDIGTNLAKMEIHLTKASERERGVEEMVTIFTKQLSDVPNAKISVAVLQEGGGPGAPIEFYLQGQDLDELERIKNELMVKYEEIPGLVNFDNSSRPGKPEITIRPKRDKIAQAGTDLQTLALTLRASVEGLESNQYKEGGNEYDIKVMLDQNDVNSPEKIKNIPVVTPTGTFRMSELADVEFTSGFSKILHRDKYTAIKFSGFNAQGVATGDIINEVNKINETYDFPPGYRISWAGMAEMQQDMVMDLGFAFLLAFLLTYMLMAAILESFWQPILILLTMPLALIGVFVLMYYTKTDFGITSMMGVIMLLGIVVNNAILILDYTNILMRDQGLRAKEALIKAAPTKLKPIIMSTLAIILGMLPMALGIGDAGKEMRIPLGVVSIGGLVASTFLALAVIPAAFYNISEFFRWIRGLFTRGQQA
jgi:HAE1 family hydrophobic/amphiphilic exporter-1